MPPVSGFHSLIDCLFEIGPVLEGAMGPVRLTNEELLAWQTNNRTRLAPWECKFIMRLSREYRDEMAVAGKRDALPPWAPEEVAPEVLAAVSDSLRDSIRAMAKR